MSNTFSKMHGRDRERYDYIWSSKQCTICGILIANRAVAAQEYVKHPEWHVDVGGVCSLCFCEGVIKAMGLNPLMMFHSDVSGTTDDILLAIDLLTANYHQRETTHSQ